MKSNRKSSKKKPANEAVSWISLSDEQGVNNPMTTKKPVGPLLFLALYLLIAPCTAESRTNIDISIGINVPPVFVPYGPPELVFIPGTYIYFIPGIEPDIFFYQGYWYRFYQRHWFRSGSYSGRWLYIPPSRMPRPLLHVPPDYRRHVPPGYSRERIPYRHLEQNWRRWERERYWERHPEKGWHKNEGRSHGKGQGKEKHGR